MTQRSKASAALAATLAAALLGGCGGDGDGGNGGNGGTDAGTPESYTLAVRPHLGTVQPGALLVLQTALGHQQFTAKVPASGDPVFKIPRQNCGPGIVALVGSDSTVYFDEGTNRNEVLGEGNIVRALVPNVCGVTDPMSLSILDELALHLSSDFADAFRRAVEAAARDYDPVAGVDPAALEELEKAAKALRDDLAAVLSATLGLPPGFQDMLPSPIDNPDSVIPPTAQGQIAATLRAIQEMIAQARARAVDARGALLEAQVALLAEEANRLRQRAQEKMASSVIAGTMGMVASQIGFRYGDPAGILAAQKVSGIGAVQQMQNIPAMLDRVNTLMPTYPPAREAIEQASANARADTPVANADLTIALRTALTPMLLRAEPLARYQQAVQQGNARFDCTVGGIARGTVAIVFTDVDNSGGLTSGDRFDLNYQNCIASEPLSGATLAKTGTMSVEYDDFNPGAPVADLRGHVGFDMRFHAGGGDAGTSTLYEARGSWVDRAAFDAPGDVAGVDVVGVKPVVLLDDAMLTLSRGGTDYQTQLGAVRLDMSPGFDSTNRLGDGQAVLRVSGMGGGVGYATTDDMKFVHVGPVFGLRSGSFTFSREFGGTGSGTIAYDSGSLFTVTLKDAAGATTVRKLPWSRIIATYLATS